MTRGRMFAGLAVLALAVGLLAGGPLAAPAANAQTGGTYDLTWSTVDGGGGTSTGGDYALSGSSGQPDAGAHSGGEYALAGGFWADVVEQVTHLFVPLIQG